METDRFAHPESEKKKQDRVSHFTQCSAWKSPKKKSGTATFLLVDHCPIG
jgi:hypothetical protein